MSVIKCAVLSKLYGKDDFAILSCVTADDVPEAAVKERRREGNVFTLTGHGLPTTKECHLEVEGLWTESKYGTQLKATSFVETFPVTRDAIIAYLSKEVKYVGKTTATRLYEEYGDNVFDVLDKDFRNALSGVRKISEKRLTESEDDWNLKQASRKVIAKLIPFGVSPKRAMAVKKEFGANAEFVIENEPYELCNVHGFGFETVDRIARGQESWDPESPDRIGCAYKHILLQAESDGHLFLSPDDLISGYRNAIGRKEGVIEFLQQQGDKVSPALIKQCGNDMLLKGQLAMTNGKIYLTKNKLYEASSASMLYDLLCAKLPPKTYDIDKAINAVQSTLPYELANKQRMAIETVLSKNVTIITGGPGTGKSTILGALVKILRKNEPEAPFLLMAPTGKAARKMREACKMDANTIDYYLCLLNGKAEIEEVSSYRAVFETDKKFIAQYIIIDEMSMIDMKTFYRVLMHVPKGCRLVLVGDVDQLPSVGAGNVLHELIRSQVIPVVVLDEIHRQALDSPIVANSQKVNKGISDLAFNDDFVFIEAKKSEDCARMCVETFKKELKRHNGDLESVAILSPMRKRTKASVWDLNQTIRESICPESGSTLFANGISFSTGVKVMNLKNTKADAGNTTVAVSNGDTGIVRRITDDGMEIDFGEHTAEFNKDMCDNLTLGYSYTIHKSQGSEMPVVIIPVLNEMKIMWKRNLLYTGITRARKRVYLIGVRSVIDSAIRTIDTSKRNTLLAQRLCALFGKASVVEFKTQETRDSEKQLADQMEKARMKQECKNRSSRKTSSSSKEEENYEQLSFLSSSA